MLEYQVYLLTGVPHSAVVKRLRHVPESSTAHLSVLLSSQLHIVDLLRIQLFFLLKSHFVLVDCALNFLRQVFYLVTLLVV